MQIQEQTFQTSSRVDFHLFAQSSRCFGPPNNNATEQHKHKHQSAGADNELSPPNILIVVWTFTKKPTMKFEHGLKERQPLVHPQHFSCVLVDHHTRLSRCRKVYAVWSVGIIGYCDSCDGNTVFQLGNDFVNQRRNGKRVCLDLF